MPELRHTLQQLVTRRVAMAAGVPVIPATEVLGEDIAAAVTLRPGHGEATPDEIIDFCKAHLGDNKVPRTLVVMGLVSSTTAYFLWGLASQGWMMYAIIFANLLGFTVTASGAKPASTSASRRMPRSARTKCETTCRRNSVLRAAS